MLTYLALLGTGARPLPTARLNRFAVGVPAGLLHDPERRTYWEARDRCAAVLSWSTGPGPGAGPDRSGGGFRAVAGWPWALDGGPLDPGPPERDRAPGWTGVWSTVSFGPDRGRVRTDPAGSGLVYVARGEAFWAVSNRAQLAAEAVFGPDPPRDAEAMAWLPHLGWFAGDETSFAGVRVLPPAASVVWRRGEGPRIERGTPPWRRAIAEREAGGSLADVLDEAADQLVAFARAVVDGSPVRPVLQLSGGKDSRLLLAAVHAAGLVDRVELRTSGFAADPDVVVAEQVAAEVGSRTTVTPPGAATIGLEAFELRLRRHVFQTAGMFGPWDLKGGTGSSAAASLTGLYGEVMATQSHLRAGCSPADEVAGFLPWAALDPAGLLTPEARARLDDWLAGWAAAELAAGTPAADLPELFYVEQRMPRWAGAAQEVNSRSPVAIPFQAPACLRAGYLVPHGDRRPGQVQFALLRRLHDGLARLPLAGSGWDPALYTGLPDGDRYGRAPVRAPAGSGGRRPGPWQVERWAELRPLFEAELLGGAGARLPSLDRTRVAAALDRFPALTRSGQTAVFAALGAAVWLDHGEEPARYPAAVRSDRVPAARARPATDDGGGGDVGVPALRTGVVPAGPGERDPVTGAASGAAVAAFCDRLLLACGATLTSRPADLGERLRDPELKAFADEAAELLAAGPPPVEPRTALTLPFWRQHAGVRHVRLQLAHPLAVPPGGGVLTIDQRVRLWLATLAAVAELPPDEVTVEVSDAAAVCAPGSTIQSAAAVVHDLALRAPLASLAPLLQVLTDDSAGPDPAGLSLRPGYPTRTVAALLQSRPATPPTAPAATAAPPATVARRLLRTVVPLGARRRWGPTVRAVEQRLRGPL